MPALNPEELKGSFSFLFINIAELFTFIHQIFIPSYGSSVFGFFSPYIYEIILGNIFLR
jgi:hypothetical protein